MCSSLNILLFSFWVPVAVVLKVTAPQGLRIPPWVLPLIIIVSFFSHPLAKLLKFYLFKGSQGCPSLHLGDGANGRLKSLSCYEKLFHSILRPFPSQLKNKQFYQILIRSGTQELTCKTSSWEPQRLPRTKQLMFHIFGLFKLFMCYLWISFPPRITNNATNVEWETHQPFSRQIVKVKNALESKKQGKLVTTSYFIFNII